jgi:hypothetical protein
MRRRPGRSLAEQFGAGVVLYVLADRLPGHSCMDRHSSSARRWAGAAWMSGAYPNAQVVPLHLHASWLNLVYFSVIQRA